MDRWSLVVYVDGLFKTYSKLIKCNGKSRILDGNKAQRNNSHAIMSKQPPATGRQIIIFGQYNILHLKSKPVYVEKMNGIPINNKKEA